MKLEETNTFQNVKKKKKKEDGRISINCFFFLVLIRDGALYTKESGSNALDI